MKGLVKEYVFVRLMPTHSHGVTLGHIEFIWPTRLLCMQASRVTYSGTKYYDFAHF